MDAFRAVRVGVAEQTMGLISVSSLILDACLVPAMALGLLVGTRIVRRIKQEQYEVIVLTLSMLAATLMIATS